MQKHIRNYMRHFGYGEQDCVLCEACGGRACDVHHVVYRSHGGSDEVENLVGLCRACHDKAHAKELDCSKILERRK